jgi:hypothetical protein
MEWYRTDRKRLIRLYHLQELGLISGAVYGIWVLRCCAKIRSEWHVPWLCHYRPVNFRMPIHSSHTRLFTATFNKSKRYLATSSGCLRRVKLLSVYKVRDSAYGFRNRGNEQSPIACCRRTVASCSVLSCFLKWAWIPIVLATNTTLILFCKHTIQTQVRHNYVRGYL